MAARFQPHNRLRPPLSPGISRRSLLHGGAAAALLAGLAACGKVTDESTQGTGSQQGGPWKFVDDRGHTASSESTPTTIVAQLSAAAALWELGIKPAAIFGESADSGVLRGNVDTSQVTWLGKTYGEFNIEEFLSLGPDLLVAPMQIKNELWYVPANMVDEIEKQCPTVGINHFATPVDEAIDRFAELAGSLGADLNAEPVTTAKAEFDAAAAKLTEVTESNPGLTVAFVSATDDNIYYANPAVFSDLLFLQQQGVNFVIPDVPKKEPHFDFLSWEKADKYPADVLLYDERVESYFTKNRDNYPTLANLPAVRAGQLTAWNPETPSAWSLFAPAVSELADTLSRCRAGIVA